MSKLPEQYQFIDFSDYGRPIALWIANKLKNTSITPIHVTTGFIISGLISIICILYGYRFAAAFFLILKSILDATDGDLARLKNKPSHIGRYYDSNADLILNFLLFLSIWHITDASFILMLLAFAGIELQGTLYHFYYVILRNKVGGDKTSRIIEDKPPTALHGESQAMVNIMFNLYTVLYGPYDKAIQFLDKSAVHAKLFPNWFMSIVSIFGLGFQLFIMALFLVLGWEAYLIPFFIGYTFLIFIVIGIRKMIFTQ